jgi:AsmA-like C-terminal region
LTHQIGREDRDEAAAAAAVRSARFRTRGRKPAALRVAAMILFGVVLLVSMAAGAFFLLLSRGPISLDWLTPRIVRALDERFAGRFDFQLRGASIASSDHGPGLAIDGLVVREGGRAIFAAPRAELSIDWPSLLIGQVKPRRLEALDLDVRLSLQPDGTVAVSAGADSLATTKIEPPPPGDSPVLDAAVASPERAALLKTAAGALRGLMDLVTSRDSPIGVLDKLGLQHGRLTIDDRTIDRVIVYKDMTLSLTKADGAMRFSLAATGPARRWTVTAAATGAPGQPRSFTAHVRDLTIDEISLIAGARAAGFDTDAPLGVDMNFSLSPSDIVLEAKGAVEIGKGFFRLDEPDHEPVMIDRIMAQAIWNRHERRVDLAPIQFKAGGFDMALAGEAIAPPELPPGADPGADAWTIRLGLVRPTQVLPERLGEKVVDIAKGSMEARVLNGQGRAVVDRLVFDGPGLQVAATGSLRYRGEFRIGYTLDVTDTPIRTLARLWPTHVAPPVRVWFVDHVPAGVIKRAHGAGDFDIDAITAMRYELSPPDASLSIEGDIANASVVEVVPGMAPITGISGSLKVTGRTASFDATSGGLDTAPGRHITIEQGRFSIADNALRPTPAALDLKVAGSVEAVADLLALPAIAGHATIPIDPAMIKGQVDGKVRIDFEIGDNPRDEMTTFAIDAVASNLTIERLIGKERLEQGNLHVIADRVGLKVTGTGRLYGAPATLDVRRGFGEKGPAQAQVTFTFDEAARARAGFGVAGVGGPISAIVRTPLPVEDLNTRIELDMSRTVFDNPVPGVVKAAGRPAKASFLMVKRGDGIALEQFNFDAGPTQAQGVIELTKEGGLRGARLAPVRLSPGDDMKLDITRAGEGLKVVARGSNFDARPMLGSLIRSGADKGVAGAGAGGGKGATDDISVEFKSPIVTGHGKQILSNVDFQLDSRGGKPRALSLTGSFGRDQLAVTMARSAGGAPQIEISTNDAGAFLAFLDIYRKMENGVLTASVQIGQNRADGTVKIHDFFVKGEPTIRQLMAQSGVSRTDNRGVTRFDPDLVRVGRLLSDFTWSQGRLAVRDGVVSGPEIGLTFEGYVDFSRDRLDLAGSYVPAYALNNLLSNIPVLGVVIAGGQNEGIFALNYHVTGLLSAPVVSVNPLSAIAPGLMRKIMGVLDGTTRMPDNGR